MSCLLFQSFLGKNVSEIKIFGETPLSKPHNNNFYSVASKEVQYIYGMPYLRVVIHTNDNGIVKKITLNLTGLIEDAFYDAFVKDFGLPTSIQITDTTKIISETIGVFNQTMRKSFITTREGAFEEKPLYIIWKKKHFQIRILMNYSGNKTRISFIKL